MLFGLLGDSSDAFEGYKANTSGLDNAAADAKKWGKKSAGLSKAGLVQQKQMGTDQASQARNLNDQADSNLATAKSMNNMFGGNALTANSLDMADESQRSDMQATNVNIYDRMMDSVRANDYGTQDYRDYDVNTNIMPDIEVKKGELANRVNMAKSQANAQDNATSKKLGSTLGMAAGAAFGPMGMMAGGMLGGMLG